MSLCTRIQASTLPHHCALSSRRHFPSRSGPGCATEQKSLSMLDEIGLNRLHSKVQAAALLFRLDRLHVATKLVVACPRATARGYILRRDALHPHGNSSKRQSK